ncbi:MAG: flavin reductase family protein [bacterium]|nr:flavin reductase family protein [bacterium]MXV91673.1 flavin reductase family protein [Acidimicrobiia bacterium]MYC45635.1 flavin reductase family protein [Acidimicrobiia bacterium]MYI20133.1 flavin reductase family protein [Acidimicrobiia bacterium]
MTPFDSAEFRRVLGHYPTGVTVVTGAAGDGPAGLAIGSFGSVSLEPPLVMFCPGKSSNSWPVIEASGSFCVNVLAEDQAAVSSLFAGRDPDKFAGISWGTRVTGSPVIEGCLAWIDCTIETVHEGGDHWIVVGRVADLGVGRPDSGPLIFFKGGYSAVGPVED